MFQIWELTESYMASNSSIDEYTSRDDEEESEPEESIIEAINKSYEKGAERLFNRGYSHKKIVDFVYRRIFLC